MQTAFQLSISVHDDVPPNDARRVATGLEDSNPAAVPLHEVRPVACFARLPSGSVVGGAVERTWGSCGELQQPWVALAQRRQGIGARLVKALEAHAQSRGCHTFYVETFSFQAPSLYRSLGYRVSLELHGFAPGIGKYVMVHEVHGLEPGA